MRRAYRCLPILKRSGANSKTHRSTVAQGSYCNFQATSDVNPRKVAAGCPITWDGIASTTIQRSHQRHPRMGDRADRLCYDMSDDAAKSGGMAKRLGDEALDLASRAEEIRAQRLVDDARHWRRRAEEIRTEAETMGESIARATML